MNIRKHYRTLSLESTSWVIKLLHLDQHPQIAVFVDLGLFTYNFIGSLGNLKNTQMFFFTLSSFQYSVIFVSFFYFNFRLIKELLFICEYVLVFYFNCWKKIFISYFVGVVSNGKIKCLLTLQRSRLIS